MTTTRGAIFRKITRTDPTAVLADAVKLRLDCGHTTLRNKGSVKHDQKRVRCHVCEQIRAQDVGERRRKLRAP